MGSISSYISYNESVGDVVYPPAECPGVIYTNIGDCIDGICPPDDSCINGIDYLFNQIDPPLYAENYILEIRDLLMNGISVFNPDLVTPICCPDCEVYFLGNVQPFLFLRETVTPSCCLNESTNKDQYSDFIEVGDSVKVCCNEFEPCLSNFEENFITTIFDLGLIETSYYDNHSNLCILNDIIMGLPYSNITELNHIVDSILELGIVIWCFNDNVFIGSADVYVEWVNNGGGFSLI